MRFGTRWTSTLLFLAASLAGARSSDAQCLDWSPDFQIGGPAGRVRALAVFDDGSGPAMFAAGDFTTVEGMSAIGIAKWNGSAWTNVGSGVNGSVSAMCVFNDGTETALYVGGLFSSAGGVAASNIAKWNGATWAAVGSGVNNSLNFGARALAVFDDGTGPALFAGGDFTTAGGVTANYVAKWNGSAWTALGGGVSGGPYTTVSALTVFDDGSGRALYVGGGFSMADTVPATNIAKWDGTTWSALGGGVANGVNALAAYDDGAGSALYAGGYGISKWDGSTWSSLAPGGPSYTYALIAFDDGSGPALFATGGGSAPVYKWNGSGWVMFQGGPWQPYGVWSLAVFDDGSGSALYVGGETAGYATLPLFLARWSGFGWVPVGRADGMTDGVSSMAVVDDGSGPSLFAGGRFTSAGSTAARHIARFDGSDWTALGSGLDGPSVIVSALAQFDDGTGPALFVGGAFTSAGGVAVNNIAKWDGTNWSALGGGVAGAACMCVFDDGTGPALYVDGDRRWDGSTWSQVGSGGNAATAMVVFNDGSGSALYSNAGPGLSKWDGTNWTPLGSGPGFAVHALVVFDDGTGAAICACGSSSNLSTNVVARWNGSAWSSLGSGTPTGSFLTASAMTVFDDGYGPALYVGLNPGCDCLSSIAKWDGSTWSYLTGASLLWINSLVAYRSPSDPDPDLYVAVGYAITLSGSGYLRGIGQYRGCGHPGVPFCFGDGTGGTCPCGNVGAPGHGCENSGSTGGAILESSGLASLGDDSLHLTCRGERATSFSMFLQGGTQVSPTVYGDGLRCAGVPLKRLFVKHAVGGIVSAPESGDPSIAARSAAQSDPLFVGSTRVYQVYYRDPSTTFCPSPMGNTWNISNGRRIQWLP